MSGRVTIAATMLFSAVLAGAASGQAITQTMEDEAQRHYRSGVQLMRSEMWDAAVDEFRAAIQIDPLLALAHYNIGQSRMAQRRYVEAAAAYEKSRSAFQQLANLTDRDRVERDRARRDEINNLRDDLAHINQAKGINPERLRAEVEQRIDMLQNMQDRDLDKHGGVPAEVDLALGSAYFRQGKMEDAERQYREALKANAKLGAAHNNLAVVLMMTNRLDEADSEAKLAEKSGFRVPPQFKQDLKTRREHIRASSD